MQSARSWLPEGALRDGVLRRLVLETAKAWSERWFAVKPDVSAREEPQPSNAADATQHRSADGAITLSAPPHARRRLALRAIGLDAALPRLTPRDQTVLTKLASASLDDLLAAFVACFPGAPACATHTPDPRRLHFSLGLGAATRLIDLSLTLENAIAARKSVMARYEQRRGLSPVTTALERQPVEVSAMIGVGQIDLTDLRALEPGDIITLDQGPADRVALAVNKIQVGGRNWALFQEGRALTMHWAGDQ
jgi:hypothetical protein